MLQIQKDQEEVLLIKLHAVLRNMMNMAMKVRPIIICDHIHVVFWYITTVESSAKRPGRGVINKTTCSSKKPDQYGNEGETF